ncbi:glycosyltransferase family 2 protein [Gaoshiqia sediminis]|uniref:Glycosyltransferase family 2 protein n=1 Tax=Gaoshiqia sediminis TaxID=2986998 RepID=A0AA42C7C6_9BACT|nr:glycosyltransferase family 2 protein [Gaoshiqia sediminis]MCW0483439.1 glycosyltransferase family 2 protein [Gaoshiqia sediminis]
MSFARRYIERNISQELFIPEPLASDLSMVVVIPACCEPDLLHTIDSLSGCTPPMGSVEVLVLLNEAEDCSVEVRRQNDRSLADLVAWKSRNPQALFNLYPLRPRPFPKKHAGAGLARKTGMDEAIRRFQQVDHPAGILVSLDADTLVEPNYLVEIEQCFASDERPIGATIQFKHRLAEIADERHRAGMRLYETYLHYYKQALAFTGFPHAIYTVGSAFAVRADAYVKQGGMSKRQAGEDFYFLHKLTQLGTVAEINSTCVYPSARLSDRVPFGTGPALQKWVNGDDRLLQTYRFQSFLDLKDFLKLLPHLYKTVVDRADLEKLPVSDAVRLFLFEDRFPESLAEIKRNSSSFKTFEKRFYQYFNAFKILKFQNFSHPRFYAFQDLEEAFCQLKEANGRGCKVELALCYD